MSGKGLLVSVIGVVITVFIAIALMVTTARIPEGQVGVVYSPNGGATEVLSPGWEWFMSPFDKVQKYPTRVTNATTEVSVTTSDGKLVTMPVRYEMKVDREKVLNIFRELGSQNVEEIQEGYLYNRIFAASRSVVSDYSVLEIYSGEANTASAQITDRVAEAAEEMGFLIQNVQLGAPALDEETQTAIDNRVKAAQENELLKLEQENALISAEIQIIEAQAEQEANEILTESLTPELLQSRYISKWDGKLPMVQGGDGVQPIVPLPELKKEDD